MKNIFFGKESEWALLVSILTGSLLHVAFLDYERK